MFINHYVENVTIEDNGENENISLSCDKWIKELCTSEPQADFPLKGGHVWGNAFVKCSLTDSLLEWGWRQDNPDSSSDIHYTIHNFPGFTRTCKFVNAKQTAKPHDHVVYRGRQPCMIPWM